MGADEQMQFELVTILERFERAAASGDEQEARNALKAYLAAGRGVAAEGSLGDIVANLAEAAEGEQGAASVLLRAIAVQGVVRPNAANGLERSIVSVVEKALPEALAFANVEPKERQTFKRYAAIEKVHEFVLVRLDPLRVAYSTVDSLLAAKADIMGSLRYPFTKRYLRPYRGADVTEVIDALIGKVERIRRMESTLAEDVDACHREIATQLEKAAEHPSFLLTDHLVPFLNRVREVVDDLLAGARGRFRTTIELATSGPDQQKRHPLHEVDRTLRINVPMRVSGPGDALDVTIRMASASEHVLVEDAVLPIGTIPPGQFSVAVTGSVIEPCTSLSLEVQVTWTELGSTKAREEIFEVRILAQRPDIEWHLYKYSNPYAEAPAAGSRFIGRSEQVHAVVARILQEPMEPTYIDGQKRVGKTSLAQTAVDEAIAHAGSRRLHKLYLLWGTLGAEDPRLTLRNLGREIEEFMIGSLTERERYPIGEYDGTLAPLLKLSSLVADREPERRFVVIIDEFDDMAQELYLQGNLAEIFFGNVRAITATPNLSLLLVGSENMPYVMDRQGQKLNRFSRINLNYFSRVDEWDDFEQLVRGPSVDVLDWHLDAINEVYTLSGGNPYFAKILCRNVMAKAVRERDADVTAAEVKAVAAEAISRMESNQFAHMWQDGIHSPAEQREMVALKRRRVLAAIARCYRDGEPATLAGIYAHRGNAHLVEAEIASLLNSFVARDVLVEDGGRYDFRLPMFRMWLMDVGLSRLANDMLAEDLAGMEQQLEDEAYVRSEEIVALVRDWPEYRGKLIGEERVRAWLSQRSGSREQRLLFTILKSLRFVSMQENLSRLRIAGQIIRDEIGTPARKSLAERRHDVVITYVDGEGKSGQRYASDFAEENKIETKAILPPSTFEESFRNYTRKPGGGVAPKAIVIIDDVVATGGSLSKKVSAFVKQHADLLNETQPLLLVHALFGTRQGSDRVRTTISALPYSRIDFRVGETLTEDAFAFDGETGVFGTMAERDRAKAIAMDVGSRIYLEDALGFGGQGLLLVLPMTVPNNTLPILHSRSKVGEPVWEPLFERLVN
jgi:orotate phosphoribosyltransferase-like protein